MQTVGSRGAPILTAHDQQHTCKRRLITHGDTPLLNWLSDAARGARFYRRGFGLLRQPAVRPFVIGPIVINTVLFVLMISWLKRQVDTLMGWLTGSSWLQWLAGLEAFAWLVGLIQAVLWLVFGIGVLIGVFYVFALVANLIAAPFNSLLAEQVERHLLDREPDPQSSSWRSLLKSIPQTLLSELRKFVYLALWIVPLLILTFIPGLNLLSSIAWLWFSAWLVALEYADFPMGNHGHNFGAVRRRLRRHRATALGFGGVASVMQSIPLINLVAMPAAVAGATAMWVDQLSDATGQTENTLERTQ